MTSPRHFDGMALIAIAFFLFMGFNIIRDRHGANATIGYSNQNSAINNSSLSEKVFSSTPDSVSQAEEIFKSELIDINIFPAQNDNEAIIPPYESYTITQGLHGFSYGHAAIDLTAGNGAIIRSPINGFVTANYLDNLGNTTLVIENDRYQVTLLHGIYSLEVGDFVQIGQPVGKESNQGNTVDSFGVSCRGRDCGYHTHLNIFDKIIGSNIDPLQLFEQ